MADCMVRKGEEVFSEAPYISIPLSQSNLFCNSCLSDNVNGKMEICCESCDAKYCCSFCRDNDIKYAGHAMVCGGENSPLTEEFQKYSLNCRYHSAGGFQVLAKLAALATVIYAGEKEMDLNGILYNLFESFLCQFPVDLQANKNKFEDVKKSHQSEDDTEMGPCQASKKQKVELQSVDRSHHDDTESSGFLESCEESWTLLTAVLLSEKKYTDANLKFYHPHVINDPNFDETSSIIDIGSAMTRILSLDRWVAVLRVLSCHLVAVNIESKTAKLARSLPQLQSLDEIKEAKITLRQYLLQARDPCIGLTEADENHSIENNIPKCWLSLTGLKLEPQDTKHCGPLNLSGPDNEQVGSFTLQALSKLLEEERRVVRLAQAAGSLEVDNPFDDIAATALVLLPRVAALEHSCMPNAHTEAFNAVIDRNPEGRLDSSFRPELRVRLVALRDILPGERLTRSRIDHIQRNEKERRQQLSALGILRPCSCYRCCHDRNPKEFLSSLLCVDSEAAATGASALHTPKLSLSADKARILKALGDVSMQENNFSEAIRIYTWIADYLPTGTETLILDDSAIASTSGVGSGTMIATSGAPHYAKDSLDDKFIGDVYHALGAAYLDSGHWLQAHRTWRGGLRLAPAHAELAEAVAKLDAYPHLSCSIAGGLVQACSDQSVDFIAGGKEAAASSGPIATAAGTAAVAADVDAQSHMLPKKYCPSLCSDFYAVRLSPRSSAVFPTQSAPAAMAGLHVGASTTPADIYLTKLPLLSDAECLAAIQMAEDFAATVSGWTTCRHYAVPTTDIPVHAIPGLLHWFNRLLEDRLAPMLTAQFGLPAAAGNKSESMNSDTSFSEQNGESSVTRTVDSSNSMNKMRISVHDAFIVKYSCCQAASSDPFSGAPQRHLPLHEDQSTHSLTIALNALGEYEGGGTYFVALGNAVRPERGHVLSFRGNLLHGGDPLLAGTRYIIAAFMLLQQGEETHSSSSSSSNAESREKQSCSELPSKASGHSTKLADNFAKDREETSIQTEKGFSFSFF